MSGASRKKIPKSVPYTFSEVVKSPRTTKDAPIKLTTANKTNYLKSFTSKKITFLTVQQNTNSVKVKVRNYL